MSGVIFFPAFKSAANQHVREDVLHQTLFTSQWLEVVLSLVFLEYFENASSHCSKTDMLIADSYFS